MAWTFRRLRAREAELSFSAKGIVAGYNHWNIDNIQFSNLPIPEPSVLGLSVSGGLLLGWRGLRQRE